MVSLGQGQGSAMQIFGGGWGGLGLIQGRLQRVFRRRPQTDVVQNQETWFALFRSTPAEVQTDRRPCCLTFTTPVFVCGNVAE